MRKSSADFESIDKRKSLPPHKKINYLRSSHNIVSNLQSSFNHPTTNEGNWKVDKKEILVRSHYTKNTHQSFLNGIQVKRGKMVTLMF